MRLPALFLLSAALLARAAEAPLCVRPEAIWQMRSVSDPRFDPSGTRIVFVEEWTEIQTDASYSSLWLIAPDGTQRRALTSGKYRDSSPRWSPDGTRIAYLSNRSGKTQIHVRDIGTGKDSVITTASHSPSLPAWSPDGRAIAYLRWTDGSPAWNPAMPAKPAGAKWAAPPVIATELRWTFDGAGVLPPGENRIFVVSSTGGQERAITPEGYHHTSYLYDPELTWAADSQAVLSPAVHAKDGWANVAGGEIYRFPADANGAPAALTAFEGQKAFIRVAGDGAIAFAGYPWKGQSYHVAKLHVMDAGGGGMRAITGDWDRDISSPVWSSDAKKIYFLSEDQGSINLYAADLSGGRRRITTPGRRLSGLTVSRSGMVAAIHSSPTQPSVLVTFPVGKPTAEKQIADPNASFLDGCPLSKAEEIWYESFDKQRIQGWILKPRSFDPKRQYPLLVSIHGGPHGMYAVNFQHEMQMYAARGYVVLYTNPRGSTGYGEDFGKVIQHNWPGDDIRDILAGVDALIAKGYVDSSRMAVMGGSGGGLMTAWMVGQTDRFRAAVSLYPVTNWFTHFGSDDNGFYIGNVYRKGMPWDEPDDYIKHSPLFYAKNFKTPTMIITGDDDWRTPIAQSNEFFRALKLRGVDTVFVRVPGEPHGLRRYPSHRLAAMVHAMAWFDKHLGQP
jgi:dipeptidyl aminopeptidase/acylaminoacyl peptidase